MNYHVEFEIEGEIKTATFDAHDIGQAYKKCLKENPAAKLVKGSTYRKWADGELYLTYPPVSTATPEPLPKEIRNQDEMELNDPRRPKAGRRKRSSPVPTAQSVV